MSYTLTRIRTGDDGTFGIWTDENDTQLCVTVERPKTGDHPCIPAGTYTFNLYNSPKHGQVWMAENVPNRTNIEVHNANFASQLLGCIGVGDRFGVIDGIAAVMDSEATLKVLRKILPSKFELTIVERFDTIQ